LGNSTSEISTGEEEHIKGVLPQLSNVLNTNDELLDVDFERYHIRSDVNIGTKDNLVLSRRRMVLPTNSAVVQKEEEKRKTKIASELLIMGKKKASKERLAASKAQKQARTSSRAAPLSRSATYKEDSDSEYDDNEE
jgi:hypothetical protein